MPASAHGTPTEVSVKKLIGRSIAPASTELRMRPATTTLVLVPIRVHKPPRIVAKLSGISSFETGIGISWPTP